LSLQTKTSAFALTVAETVCFLVQWISFSLHPLRLIGFINYYLSS